jgi:flagellar hook-associated protein 1 FlgK
MSDFSGLQTALSALYAQRRGLELAGHNVANANTEGYSRQRVNMQSVGAPAAPAFWAKWEGDGAGVRVSDVTRFRDQFLEIRAALEHGTSGLLDRVRTVLEQLETAFGEPSDVGIQAQLNQLWTGWDDLANHPGDMASRTQMLERAGTLASTFNALGNAMTAMRKGTVNELDSMVADINAKAATIAQLNDAIKNRVASGLSANDLLDQRDLLANQLAGQVGATIRPGDDGQIIVQVGGTPLVYAQHAEKLLVDSSGPTIVVRWQKDNFPAAISSGEVGGMLQNVNQTLPNYLAGLDAIAVKLRDDVNALHSRIAGSIPATARDQSAAGNLQFQIALNGGAYATATVAGADWSGAGGAAALQTALQNAVDASIGAGNTTVTVTGGAGQPLEVSVVPTGTNTLRVQASGANTGFATLLGTTSVGLDGIGGRSFFTGTSASSLAVHDDVKGLPNAVAAGVAGKGQLDGSLALDMAELSASTSGADANYRAYIVALGVDSQTTQHRSNIQNQTTDQIDNARLAQSAVNVDEEMVNLVQFQRAYEASARVMTTIDQMLETLVNRTGLVGR